MKKILCTLFFFALLAGLSGQTQATQAAPAPAKKESKTLTPLDEASARAAVEKLAAKYSLNADQAKQTYTIQARQQRNMAGIEPLKTSNPALYRSKVESVQRGTAASFRRVLRTKEQVELFNKTLSVNRAKRAELRKTMMLNGASKEEIERAALDVFEL